VESQHVNEPTARTAAPPAGTALRLALSWGLVSIPLVWGVYQTVVKSMALFE
jgi:hypothetical protein